FNSLKGVRIWPSILRNRLEEDSRSRQAEAVVATRRQLWREGSQLWRRPTARCRVQTGVAGGGGGLPAARARRAPAPGGWGGWRRLGFGRPTGRTTSYPTDQRIAAVVAGLACGLRGVGPGNLLLRPNSALRQRLGGRASPTRGRSTAGWGNSARRRRPACAAT